MFNQTFDVPDLAIIGLLIVLEGVLSIDNALVLGLLAKRLPKHQQKKALTYGLIGAFAFRCIAIVLASLLLKWWWVKLLGGGYLLYVALKHFLFEGGDEHDEPVKLGPDGQPILDDAHPTPASAAAAMTPEQREQAIASLSPTPTDVPGSPATVTGDAPVATTPGRPARAYAKFWPTVFVIEMTDIAFAVDSILAAIAMIPAVPASQTNPKLWVVITGGMLGVILMRFAAVMFIKLLEKFPRLEISAYLLVIVIGLKLLVDWYFNKPPLEHDATWHAPMDFHSPTSPAFWTFWVAMVVCFAVGFLPKKDAAAPKPA
jgi:YkoY family integral membrane protein